MTIMNVRDGEMRIYDAGSDTSQYLTVLFINADFTAPTGRAKPEEMLHLDRGKADSNATYGLGSDDPVLEPLALTFTVKMDDITTNFQTLQDMMTGATTVRYSSGTTTVYSTQGTSVFNINGSAVTVPMFADSSKITYDVQVLWDSSTNTDHGYNWREVYFPPNEQNLTEGEDAVTIGISGMIYGSVATIAAFASGSAL